MNIKIFILIIITIIMASNISIAEEVSTPLSPAKQAADAQKEALLNATTIPTEPKPDWMKYKDVYGEQLNLAEPHRSNEEMQQWVQKIITDLFDLTPTNYKEKLKKFKNYFEKSSWAAYAKHLKQSQILNLISKQQQSTEAIVKNIPEIIEGKNKDGVYHWIIKTQIASSSFVTGGNNKRHLQQNNDYTVYIDAKRVENSFDDMNIKIDSIRFDGDLASRR